MLDGILGEQLTLSPELFRQFQQLIYSSCGISLADSKRTMLSVRLTKRLRALDLSTFEEYLAYIRIGDNFSNELQDFLNVITTNKTDFYREKHHFDYLVRTAIPSIRSVHQVSENFPLEIWSAGCSSGEEPYTIAMELAEIFGAKTGHFNILATDISTKVLKEAMGAVYAEQDIAPIPQRIKEKYLLRGTDDRQGFFKIAPEIRKHIKFGRLNFTCSNFQIPTKMHVIFCRNVLIYFDAKTRDIILKKLCRQLKSCGYLFVGHSETLHAADYQLQRISPTVYQKMT